MHALRRAIASCLLALASCGEPGPEPSALAAPEAYLPLEPGRSWTYEAWSGKRRWTLTHVSEGGDRRDLPPFGQIDYDFTYGTLAGEDHSMAKSIYARPPGAPRLFYFDALYWASYFEPPLPLLPDTVEVGATWQWKGKADFGERDAVDSAARLEIEAVERLEVPAGTFEAIRVRQVHATPRAAITRWFAAGVGLLREERTLTRPDGSEERSGLALVAHAPPRPKK